MSPIAPAMDVDQSGAESPLSEPLSIEASVDVDLALRDEGSCGQKGGESWGLFMAPPKEEVEIGGLVVGGEEIGALRRLTAGRRWRKGRSFDEFPASSNGDGS